MNRHAPQFNPTFKEQMTRYHGEIARLVDAAEIACLNKDAKGTQSCQYHSCPFNDPWNMLCRVTRIRIIIGDIIRPIGLCEHGEAIPVGPDETYIRCHSLKECDYQISGDGNETLCGREAAALILAEEPEEVTHCK
jgi:hypothetical protein